MQSLKESLTLLQSSLAKDEDISPAILDKSKELTALVVKYEEIFIKVTAQVEADPENMNALKADEAMSEAINIIRSFESNLKDIQKFTEEMMAETVRQCLADSAKYTNLMLVSAGGGFIAALILGLYISNSISKSMMLATDKLASASEQILSASSQVSSSSQSLAEGASEQAASLEETSASQEELTSMTRSNAENSEAAHIKAGDARKFTEQSTEDMGKLSDAMNEMSKIIKSIDEIAFQTNILALNAAVEAARAGEAGAGFAVVADEVRNLAQRSADAARETSNKIEQGTQMTHKVKESLDKTLVHVRDVDKLVDEITNSSREQSQGISQISIALNQMDKVTQSSAANAEETAAASEELTSQAHELTALAAQLYQFVNGGSVETPNHPIATRAQAATSPVSQSQPARIAARAGNVPMLKIKN